MSFPVSSFKSLTLPFTSGHLERISIQLSQAISGAIRIPARTIDDYTIPGILHSIHMWKSRPILFTEMAYDWCSVICERSAYMNGESSRALLFLSLEIGFRNLGSWDQGVGGSRLTHTEHHQKMADVVFKSGDAEAIADLLYAWTLESCPYDLLHTCASYLVDLQHFQEFSPRLRQLLVYSIKLIGYPIFEQIEGEGFFELLNRLDVRVGDMDDKFQWGKLLLAAIKSTKGLHSLRYEYWELIAELAISYPMLLRTAESYDQHVMDFLMGVGEWGKLQWWFCVVWASWGPNTWPPKVKELGSMALSLFHNQPGAYQKVEGWMERLGQLELSEFQQMFPQANFGVIGRCPL